MALKNNVSTIEMEMTCQRWKPDTAEFVPHHVMADYIQGAAIDNRLINSISFNTRVNDVKKIDGQWRIDIATLRHDNSSLSVMDSTKVSQVSNICKTATDVLQCFDAVVIATGHYHACNVPNIDGLAEWKRKFPRSVSHSKVYRKPDEFKGQNVLLIGSGVSSMDIARDLGNVARSVYQSSRGGPYDLPSHLLLENGARVGGIRSFDALDSDSLASDESIPGTITLQDGQKLCNIHRIIVCTGYHVSFPFMKQYHADGILPADADDRCLVTDGQQTHNLHKDIWYISDPTLAFIGVPYHVATFSCFEFQAMALAASFSGQVPLPSEEAMRKEYVDRIRRKGAGRTAHSLKAFGDEIGYVNELRDFVNGGSTRRDSLMDGHTQRWHEAYLRRVERGKLLFGKIREPSLDRRVIDLIQGC